MYNGFFGWDDAKNQLNVKNHGFSFWTGMRVFDDLNYLLEKDRVDEENGEQRWNATNLVNGKVLVPRLQTKTRRCQKKNSSTSFRRVKRSRAKSAATSRMPIPIERMREIAASIPPITEEEKAQLDALEGRPINFCDQPPLTEEQLAAAFRPYQEAAKELVAVRLDRDVLAWLRAPGKGYSSRMNRVLRAAMTNSMAAPKK